MPFDLVSPRPIPSKPRRSSDATSRTSPAPHASKNQRRKSNHPGAVTLRDIAKQLGISHVTVSLALRDAPGVSESRRRQIQIAAAKMGYQPNANAAALGRRRSASPAPRTATTLAWLGFIPDLRQSIPSREITSYLQGARDAAKKYGYVIAEWAASTASIRNQLLGALKAQTIAGVLLPFPSVIPKSWETFPWQNFPVVRLGRFAAQLAVPSVASDHFSNAHLAFEKIRALGYPRVGIVTNHASDTRYAAGFITAQLDLPEPQRIPVHYLTSRTNSIVEQQRLDQWIRQHRPNAILTDLAILSSILKSADYRVPEDIGLAYLNNLESPNGAGIDPKPEAVGNAAAEMLILQLNARGLNIPGSHRELLIAGEWAHGATLPPRAGFPTRRA